MGNEDIYSMSEGYKSHT